MPKKDKVKELTGKLLTKKLCELAVDIIEIDPSTEKATTRAEKLAKIVWDHALGYTERTENKEGSVKEVKYKPAPWAITLLMDRIEGKVANAIEPGIDRPTLRNKLSSIGTKRINKI